MILSLLLNMLNIEISLETVVYDLRLTVDVGLLGVAWFSKILSSFFYNFIVKINVIKKKMKILTQYPDVKGGRILHKVFKGIFLKAQIAVSHAPACNDQVLNLSISVSNLVSCIF